MHYTTKSLPNDLKTHKYFSSRNQSRDKISNLFSLVFATFINTFIIMYQWRELCLMALLGRASAQSFALPLLGPDFLPPNLPGNGTFPAAMQSFDTTLTQALASGAYKSGPLSTNDTSFSIAFFDAKSILHEFTHSAPSLQEDASGVSHVDLNTIYRIGSVSKLLTVYLFLIEVGDGYWDDSVTKFIPELKQAVEDCSARQDPVDCIDWSNIKLGALAGQMAGFPRDCECFENQQKLTMYKKS